jgi:hypothetical protein
MTADTVQALRETSDALLRDLEALMVLEDEKRQVTPGDPRLVDLASQIEEIAGRVLMTSARERELTERIQVAAEAGSPAGPGTSIDDTPRPIAAILADWREAERRLEAASDGTAEAREAEVLVDRLRDEYRKAHEAARAAKGPDA